MKRSKLIEQLFNNDSNYDSFNIAFNKESKKYFDNKFLSNYENYYYQNIFFISKVENIVLNSNKIVNNFFNILIAFISVFIIIPVSIIHYLIIFYRLLGIKHFKKFIKGDFSVALCKQSLKKLECFSEVKKLSLYCLYDDLRMNDVLSSNKHVGMLELLSLSDRIKLFLSLKFLNVVIKNIYGYFLISRKYDYSLKFLFYFLKRFGIDSYSWLVLDNLLSSLSPNKVYSASTNERYAIALKRLCVSNSIKTVCIPHGISPKLKLPNGIFGDEYFALSKIEMNYLSENYLENTYIYNDELNHKMFKVTLDKEPLTKKFVYCTTSRNREEDEAIINKLCSVYEKIYVKLHPNDKEGNYRFHRNALIIESYPEAIVGNIVISRLSAVLIDASYNNSIPIMLIDNSLDIFDYKFLYEGIRTQSVIQVCSFNELTLTIKGLLLREKLQ